MTGEALAGHIQTPKGAHTASAIEHDGYPDILGSSNVEGALDELIGTVAKRPPYLGQWDSSTSFSGIPDWGFLKLRDASLNNYDMTLGTVPLANMPSTTNPDRVFPYYFSAPGPAQDSEFPNEGEDPRTDWVWNTGMELWVGPEWGRGYGRCHIGAFTRAGDVGPAPKEVMKTARLYPRPTGIDPETALPYRVPVTVSGTIFPADRGVLALFHFPSGIRGVMTPEFLGMPLITDETVIADFQGRVVAAILLGNGILGDKCNVNGPCAEAHLCDGDPGGIFGMGSDPVTSKYNPFTFPGRAAGQYDLKEIHLGEDSFGNPLVAPWNDLDGDTVQGSARTATATIPAPGQVRLGTDPDAGVTPVDYGIPILGGTVDYFDVAPTSQLGSLGFSIKGDSMVVSANFFRYRLPALKDYSQETGLKWTPRGDSGINTQETHRFFETGAPTATVYSDGDPVLSELRTAGYYEPGFDEDYWVWQIARYRHSFLMPSTEVGGLREEVGSYWMVHFKAEKDFEKFARDGIFPWHATEGYDVYGYSLLGSPPVHIEEDKNVVNEWPAATPPVSPEGPAPTFGYAANPYHGIRSTIILDPDGTALPLASVVTYDWSSTSNPGVNEAIMWSSGVAYHTPRLANDGVLSFEFLNIDLTIDPGFWTTYRTNQDDLTIGIAPARIASPNPLFLNVAPWAYGVFGAPRLVVPVGAPGAAIIPSTDYLAWHRIEVPFEHLGSNGGGVFSNANGPLDADTLVLSSPDPIEAEGDELYPSFVRDAQLRAYLRRPFNHTADDTPTLPFTANDGHGQVLAMVPAGTQLLFHSTQFDKTNRVGTFGNYVVAAVGAPPNTSYTELFPALKTTDERFLDETFRIVPSLSTASAAVVVVPGTPYTVAAMDSLVGPGMQGWVGGPIEIPVKIGYAVAPWNLGSWLLNEYHLEDLVVGDVEVQDGLQVVGLPDRNPPQSAAVQVPFPTAGMLAYPRDDFTPMSPFGGGTHFVGVQPDYTAAAGSRQYVRVFDAAYRHYGGATAMSLAGQTSLVLRIDGLLLEDLAYAAPGPGGLTVDRPAISIKIPGLTTWMDIGRADGAGPSKQDMFADGAGCMESGIETYSFMDSETGYVGCYVKVNLGPVASLFENTATWAGYVGGLSPLGESPVLLKVEMDVGVINDYDLEHRNIAGVFEGAAKPGAAPNTVRGLFGITVVHPNDRLIDSLADAGVVLP